MEVLLYTVLTLCVLGILAALILYFVAQKFKVEEAVARAVARFPMVAESIRF